MPLLSRAPALFADLYELTMAEAYRSRGMSDRAVFEVFFRTLPEQRSYVLAAGLSDVLDFLEGFRFEQAELEYLRSLRKFSDEFLSWLSTVRFTGDVWALPEGTVVFPNEPILQVAAPIIEAQLVETFVLNQIHLQSVLASKASRVVQAAQGRTVVEFGARRAHGIDAANKAARTSYIAGAQGTSNLLAGMLYGIPVFGTMAHSFVQSFQREEEAFATFATLYPGTTLLVDTYDSLRGVDRVIDLARWMGDRFSVGAIRLDSGDLIELSKAARRKLDSAGLHRVTIFASSNLDEHEIARIIAEQSPITGFGVGTQLSSAVDSPTLDLAYKLVEYAGIGRTKLSSKKVIYPGRKQVFRRSEAGSFCGDVVALAGERLHGEPLLSQVMENGRRVESLANGLDQARRRATEQVRALPPELRALTPPASAYQVRTSDEVRRQLDQARRIFAVDRRHDPRG